MYLSLLTLASLVPSILTSPTTFPSAGPQISNSAATDVRPGHYIIRYHDHITDTDIAKHEAVIQSKLGVGCTTTYNFNLFKACHLETDLAGLAAITSPVILSYELDSVFSISPLSPTTPLPVPSPPNSSFITSTKNAITQTGAPWNLGRISHKKPGITNYVYDASACQGTTIYIVDTGIRVTHVEFGGRARLGANFVNANPPTDDHGHGTHCAGTAVGATVGVCRLGSVVAVKVLDNTGFGYNTWIIAGIQWAVNDALSNPNITGKAVISISIGGGYSPTLNAAVTAAVAAGIPVSVAAGNNNQDSSLFSPSSALNAIVVGATDISDNKAGFSNFGKGVSVWAPGVNVLSAFSNCDGCYYWYSGTSQATPHVAALAAYLITLDSLKTPSKVLSKIRSIATNRIIAGALGGASNKLAYNGNGA